MKIYNLTLNVGTSPADQQPQSLAHDPRFCIKYEDGCATWISDNDFIKPTKGIFSLVETVLFAVKTCKKLGAFQQMVTPLLATAVFSIVDPKFVKQFVKN